MWGSNCLVSDPQMLRCFIPKSLTFALVVSSADFSDFLLPKLTTPIKMLDLWVVEDDNWTILSTTTQINEKTNMTHFAFGLEETFKQPQKFIILNSIIKWFRNLSFSSFDGTLYVRYRNLWGNAVWKILIPPAKKIDSSGNHAGLWGHVAL